MTAARIPDNWRDGKTVQECNRYMLNEQIGCDVEFRVGNPGEEQLFRAHKYMLASRSSVFDAMFFGPMPQDTDIAIEIPDVHPRAFQQMLWFMYWDFTRIDDNLLYVIGQVAEKYNLKELYDKCNQRMRVILSTENVLDTLDHYVETNLDPILLEACLQYIYYHTKDVFAREEFLRIKHSSLRCILENHRLNLPEEDIFERMIEWAQAERTRRADFEIYNRLQGQPGKLMRSVLTGDVINCILFNHMSREYFADTVIGRFPQLLTLNHENQVFRFICSSRPIPAEPLHPRRLIFMRFRKVLSGKGYPSRNKDALSFTISKNVVLNKFLIYGSCQYPGQYNLEVKMVRGKNPIDPTVFEDNTIQKETDGFLKLHEVKVHPHVIPIRVERELQRNTTYSLFVKFQGPTSFKGERGHEVMTHDGTTIKFMNNMNGLNGTTSKLGQFPGFMFTNMEDGVY